MWLLSTDRAELHYFVSPESVSGPYAILSHVWGQNEQSHQELQNLAAECALIGRNPRDYASPKIRDSCALAESHGYDWLWVDTCCIDKTSSAELSEAINSMFRYYALADVCYAYLRDVPSDDPVHEHGSRFRESRWHTRGWTLQELLAPRFVVFVSASWTILGAKVDFAELLEEVTGIPRTVVALEEDLASVSVADRMSWAANRRTTRREDEAYCLFGIFGVNLPTLYGEGEQAFLRLQEEIMKVYADTSLFAWGLMCPGNLDPRAVNMNAWREGHIMTHHRTMYLLAVSPSAFRQEEPSGTRERIIYYQDATLSAGATSSFTPYQRVLPGVPTFSVTPHGILARLAVVISPRLPFTIVVLQGLSYGKKHLGLILMRCPYSVDSLRPLYDTGVPVCRSNLWCFDRNFNIRLITLGDIHGGIQVFGSPAQVEWQDLLISYRPPPAALTSTYLCPLTGPRIHNTPFRFPPGDLQELINRSYHGLRLVADKFKFTREPWLPSSKRKLMLLKFELVGLGRNSIGAVFTVQLGVCDACSKGDPGTRDKGHWANVPEFSMLGQGRHACPGDHISGWKRMTRTFLTYVYPKRSKESADLECEVTLAFKPWPMNPDHTLLIEVSAATPSQVVLSDCSSDTMSDDSSDGMSDIEFEGDSWSELSS